jgi:hypothetical protein
MAIIVAWCRNRSRIAVALGTSPMSLPQASKGRLRVVGPAKDMREAQQRGEQLGLTDDEIAF